MPLPKPNTFSSYTLSPEESMQGALLTSLNICVIQNLISQIAEEKVMLTYDPANPLVYAQREAELHGQILILQQLINNHNEATQTQLKLNLDTQEIPARSSQSYFTIQE
jgi:hypothetical protein